MIPIKYNNKYDGSYTMTYIIYSKHVMLIFIHLGKHVTYYFFSIINLQIRS